MKKSIRLTETQLIDAINTIIEKSINEADSSTGISNASPGKEAGVKTVVKKIDADSLFATGKSEPNTNSRGFKEVVKGIVNAVFNGGIKKPFEIKVQGGASAVGTPGFDNKKLADRRRDKMINVLTQEVTRQVTVELDTTSGLGFDANKYFRFVPVPSIVGVATVKDSPEAKAEQFVKVSYPTTGLGATNATTAIDKTASGRPPMDGGELTPLTDKTKDKGITLKLINSSNNKVVVLDTLTHMKINKILKEKGMYLSPTNVKKPSVGGVS
jgi:hypothetical protein